MRTSPRGPSSIPGRLAPALTYTTVHDDVGDRIHACQRHQRAGGGLRYPAIHTGRVEEPGMTEAV